MTAQLLTDPKTRSSYVPEATKVFTPPESGWVIPANAPGRTPWVVLDRTWARSLGLQRTGGVYRMNRRELIKRLETAQEAASILQHTGRHISHAA